MSEIDISSILAALRRMERQPNNRRIKPLLLNKGIPESIAQPVSMNELCYWTEEEVNLLFDRLHISPAELRNMSSSSDGLKSFNIELSPIEIAVGEGPTDFVKPTMEMVVESAKVLGALCVNMGGEFCIDPAEGYVALSHVWSQGLGGDSQGRGLHRSLVRQVFEKLNTSRNSGGEEVKWVWTDSLAIPGGGQQLAVKEEEIKARLINAMAGIYRVAKEVVILDALVLRLASVDCVDVAVGLALGKWLTRVWTYQEIKLATNAAVATRTGLVSFASICDTLRHKAYDEVGDGYDTSKQAQFPALYRTFARLQRNDNKGVSLPDIAIGIGYREAMDKLDYARSVFPTLGLEWRFGDGIDQAMRKIYEAQRGHATRLVLYHGPPRASYPGWAPRVFPGLVDSKIITAGIWKRRGMERDWLTTRIRKIVPSKPGAVILELDNQTGTSPGAYCLCYVSKETEKDSPESVALFREAVDKGTAYLLSDEPLVPKQHFARVGLMVERFTKPKPTEKEAWVIMTLAIGETEPEYAASRDKWLLLHENPTHHETGKALSELNYSMTYSPDPDVDSQLERYPLHKAAAAGDVAGIHGLTSGPGYIDVNEQDPRGWTALHYASASGHPTAVSTLCNVLGATTSLTIPTRNAETPLVLAIDNGHVDAAMELFEAGADVNCFAPGGFSPLTTACWRGNLELVRMCLAMGADPNLEDGLSFKPVVCAVKPENEAEDYGGTELLKELIEAGAEVDGVCKSGASALYIAVRQGSLEAVKMLLATGRADPDGANKQLSCLAQFAIEGRFVGVLQALLEHGARVDGPGGSGSRFDKGWTAMMCAAAVGDVPIGRLLRKYGADMFASGGDEGWTPLHVAAVKEQRLFFKWLVEEGDVSGRTWGKDRQGQTGFDLKTWV